MSETEAAHIVVTDDEKDVRETVQEYLTLQGLKASAADSGAALRRIMAEQPVDLVLLDIRMPGEDGLTIARQLRATSTTGIIMLTAAGEVVDRVRSEEHTSELQPRHYLVCRLLLAKKPVEPSVTVR